MQLAGLFAMKFLHMVTYGQSRGEGGMNFALAHTLAHPVSPTHLHTPSLAPYPLLLLLTTRHYITLAHVAMLTYDATCSTDAHQPTARAAGCVCVSVAHADENIHAATIHSMLALGQ